MAGTAFTTTSHPGSNQTKDPDIQQTIVADLIDERPGKELLAFTKDALMGLPCDDFTYFLFDSTQGLEALAWGNDGDPSNNQPLPGLYSPFQTDFLGDRSTVELHSMTFNAADNCAQEGIAVFTWVPESDPTTAQGTCLSRYSPYGKTALPRSTRTAERSPRTFVLTAAKRS